MNRKTVKERAQILSLLVEGNSLRATNSNAAARMAEEADIIAYFQPPLNKHLK